MDTDRILDLFDGATSWIWDHCEGDDDEYDIESSRYASYCFALSEIGFDANEACEELIDNCGMTMQGAADVVEYVYGYSPDLPDEDDEDMESRYESKKMLKNKGKKKLDF